MKVVSLGGDLNAYTVAFDPALLEELRAVYAEAIAGYLIREEGRDLLGGGKPVAVGWEHYPYKFRVTSYGHAPLLWISNDNLAAYQLFERFFRSLDVVDEIKSLVDFEQNIVLYCGFFVVGDHLDRPAWHVDYFEGANAYTLITPLFDLESGHGRLLFRDDSDREPQFPKIGIYSYRVGEAIVVGEGFAHSTEPYRATGSLRVLASLTFGTDKLEYWKVLKQTAGKQSNFMILPCGHRMGNCSCLESFDGDPVPMHSAGSGDGHG